MNENNVVMEEKKNGDERVNATGTNHDTFRYTVKRIRFLTVS